MAETERERRMCVTGKGGGRPPVRVGVSIIDMGAGTWAAIGILAALTERARSGKGDVVDVSLYETALSWMLFPLNAYFASGEVPGRQGSGIGTIIPYQVFPTRNSFLMVAAGDDNLFSGRHDPTRWQYHFAEHRPPPQFRRRAAAPWSTGAHSWRADRNASQMAE